MDNVSPQQSGLKLSICITTFNRAGFIGATLDSILVQMTDECEIVVLDGASTDHTEQVMQTYARRSDRVRYVRQEVNKGFDRDCDRAVELARGEYCWLMTDDDLLKPGAVAAVLQALQRDLSLIIANTEVRDFSLSKVLQARCIDCESDRVYGSSESDRLFSDIGGMLTYVGGFIVKRSIWISREKHPYYDSSFVHVGVIFQERLPGETLVIAAPLVSYRMGNGHTWSRKWFELFVFTWPSLVWSLPLSESAKRKVCRAERWRDLQQLLEYRGRGCYSFAEYRRLIHPRAHSIRKMLAPALVAVCPGVLVNAMLVLYYSVTSYKDRGMLLQFMRESRYYFRNWRVFSYKSGRTG